ncbi:MAG: acyl-ACP--UDP-N-acetylglucosamine O-acyltransferase [Verrucomicrobiota bacterium]
MKIHATAVVDKKAELAEGVEVGPYCVIGANVKLSRGCVLMHHVSLAGSTTIGKQNVFHPFCSIGGKTQDLKYAGEPTFLEIGDGNEFREFVTINRGTGKGEKTIIGSNNLLLAYSHVAHNCVVGNHCVFSNNGTLAGHVTVEDHAVIGGLAAVHQFCRIGQHAMIGGCSKIVQDVPPYFIADGNPAEIRGVNFVGLQRKNFSDESIKILKQAWKILYNPKFNTSQALDQLQKKFPHSPEVQTLIRFIESSQRGIIR